VIKHAKKTAPNPWLENSVLWKRIYIALGEGGGGTINKGRKFNPKRIIKWLIEIWYRK